jgi:hypothetical protein
VISQLCDITCDIIVTQGSRCQALASWEACNLACNGCNYMSYMLDVMGL